MLIFGATCETIGTGIANSLAQGYTKVIINPLLIINAEVATLIATSTAFKDSVGTWPDNRTTLTLFYNDNKESFSNDSLLKQFRYSEENFSELTFLDMTDSLTISFHSNLMPDTLYQKIFKIEAIRKKIQFFRYSGYSTIYPDSTTKSKYNSHILIDSLVLYNSDKIEYGYGLTPSYD